MTPIGEGTMDVASGVYQLDVGVDVAADTFTASWLASGGAPTVPCTGEQTPGGYAALQRRLRATAAPPAATLVVLEATGNDWVALAVALHEAGYRVAVVNPRQAHHFAKAQLRRATTDALDAQDLARLAAALQPAPWTPPPAVDHEARQRLVARDALLAMRTQARNQRHALLQWPVVVEGVQRHLDELIAGCPLGAWTGGSPGWKPRSPRCCRRASGRSRSPA
jgi:transposase